MAEIERLARAYADAREALDEVVEAVRDEQRAAARARLRSIRGRAARLAAAREALAAAIDASRELFVRPRTRALHGVKCGLRKSPGRIEGDAAGAVARIEARLPEQAARLVRTRKDLNKAALATLPAQELAALGVAVVDVEDKVVVQAAGGDLERLVDALLDGLGEASDGA